MTSPWRSYDSLTVGDSFPDRPARYTVTREVVDGFRRLTAGSRADAAAPAGADASTVPPMLAAVYIRDAQTALKGPPGGIHAKQRFTFLHPVAVGDELDTVLTVKDKYERKGRRYVVLETRTRDRAGTEVTVGEIVAIWGQER